MTIANSEPRGSTAVATPPGDRTLEAARWYDPDAASYDDAPDERGLPAAPWIQSEDDVEGHLLGDWG